jgi:hypothetical protein
MALLGLECPLCSRVANVGDMRPEDKRGSLLWMGEKPAEIGVYCLRCGQFRLTRELWGRVQAGWKPSDAQLEKARERIRNEDKPTLSFDDFA